MTQRERESLGSLDDRDAHETLFGLDHDNDDPDHPREEQAEAEDAGAPRLSRSDRRRRDAISRKRHNRRGRIFAVVAVLLVAAAAWIVVPRVSDHFKTQDYSGSGTGSTTISIPAGATAGDIADILHRAGVVKSAEAFTHAASGNSRSTSIQPGAYKLHSHMSGQAALALLLDPSSRSSADDVTVTEGQTIPTIEARLVTIYGADKKAEIDKALHSGADLGLPIDFTVGNRTPSSAEGFLFPARYTVDPTKGPTNALTAMVSKFTDQARQTGFTAAAKKLGITPYQALIVASIAQAEAKYPQDMPKVTRTILNRLRIGKPLESDATSAYGAKIRGVDPSKIVFSQFDSPYNSYQHAGLPPTPIGNPGQDAMNAAVHPATGNWIYFVNGDAAGHLVFTADQRAFAAAAEKCRVNHWGCG